MRKVLLAILMGVVMLLGAITMPALALDKEICSGLDAEQAIAAGCSAGGETELYKTVRSIFTVVISVIGVIAVIAVIYGGITFMTSAGDPGKITKGRRILIFGVVGVAVSLLAFAIVNFVLKKVS